MRVRGTVQYWKPDGIYFGDSRDPKVESESVDLIVTSPPYCVGKSYEEELQSFSDWVSLISSCLPHWWRVLRNGGKLCINVANTGRKPYNSLVHALYKMVDELNDRANAFSNARRGSHNSSILQLDLLDSLPTPYLQTNFHHCFLPRGEIIWDKNASVGTSCAWGSYGSPGNPCLRDVHEYIVVFVKPATPYPGDSNCYKLEPHGDSERFKGCRPIVDYLPEEQGKKRFAELTKSKWEMGTANARSIGHEAPFPVELPKRCIELFVWPGGVVYDPFMGSGQTAIACLRLNKERSQYEPVRYVGNDYTLRYVELAKRRIREEGVA